MNVSRITPLAIAVVLLTLPVLSGCSSKIGSNSTQSTLMERYHSGEPLVESSSETLNDDQKTAMGHYNRGLDYASNGRYELAFEQFSRASALDPELAMAYYQRGLLLKEKGLTTQALGQFEIVSQKLPDFALAHEAAGMVYFQSALYPEAEKHLAKALLLDPTLVRSHIHLGAIYNYRKDYDQALLCFQAALAVDPANGSVYNNLGMTYSMMERHQDAVGAFRTALRLGAPSAKAYNNMGLALAHLGMYAEALEAFRCAEGEAAAYNNLGYVYFLDGQYTQAIASFEKAIELEPAYYERANENLKRARLALRFEDVNQGQTAPAMLSEDLPDIVTQPVRAEVPAGPLRAAKGQTWGPSLTKADPTPGVPAKGLRMAPGQAPRIPASTVQPSVDPAPKTKPISLRQPKSLDQYAMAPVAGERVYTLHMSSWRNPAKACRQASKLRAQGLEAYVQSVQLADKGDWYRVSVGSYNSFDTAREQLQALKADRKIQNLRIVRLSGVQNSVEPGQAL